MLTTLGEVVVAFAFALETAALLAAEAAGEDIVVAERLTAEDSNTVPLIRAPPLSDVEYAAAGSDTTPLALLPLAPEALVPDVASALFKSDLDVVPLWL